MQDSKDINSRAAKRSLSEVLGEIAADEARETISVNDLITILAGRGRAVLVLFFALPNILPTPPGTSSILGLPLLYLSFQMMIGRLPWLPSAIGERKLTRERFCQLVERMLPLLKRTEKLMKARLGIFASHSAEKPIGALCLILAIVLTLPIPLGNMPPAFAMSLMALGILERDGLWVLIGAIIGLASMLLVSGVIYAMAKTAIYLFMNAVMM